MFVYPDCPIPPFHTNQVHGQLLQVEIGQLRSIGRVEAQPQAQHEAEVGRGGHSTGWRHPRQGQTSAPGRYLLLLALAQTASASVGTCSTAGRARRLLGLLLLLLLLLLVLRRQIAAHDRAGRGGRSRRRGRRLSGQGRHRRNDRLELLGFSFTWW